jgi:glycine oxidase
MHIGIAGAGLLGRLLAFELARTGHSVEVFDPAPGPQAPAAGVYAAGWTAAGMLSPTAELESADDKVFALGLRSLELWPAIVAALDLPVEMHQRGSLLLAHRGDEGAARRVVDLLQHKAPAGHAPQALDAAALRALEPAIHGGVQAWLLPHEGQIHSVQAMAALAQAAAMAGANFHWGVMVSRLLAGEVHTPQGLRRFDCVFDVRGTGARPAPADRTPTDGFTPDVRGVRGEIFWLHAPGVSCSARCACCTRGIGFTSCRVKAISWWSAPARSRAKTARPSRCAARWSCWPQRTASFPNSPKPA